MGVFGVFGTVSGAEKRGDEKAKITFQKKKGRKTRKKPKFCGKSQNHPQNIFVAVSNLV